MNSQERLILALLKAEIQYGEFTFRSGQKSSWYLDARPVTFGHPSLVGFAVSQFINPRPEGWVGVIAGGVPISTAASVYSHRPAIGVRPERKDHGASRVVYGPKKLMTSEDLVMVDDVFTTGSAMRDATYRMLEEGWETPDSYMVLVNRSEHQDLDEFLGVPFRAMFNLKDLGVA